VWVFLDVKIEVDCPSVVAKGRDGDSGSRGKPQLEPVQQLSELSLRSDVL
jgi:hypothetical protein